MPLYSYRCEPCARDEDRFSTIAARNDQDCTTCGTRLTRTYAPAAVQDDTIIGGFRQENFGDKVEVFYSKKEMARRAKELGLEPFVRHQPPPGTDKSDKTSRWV